MEKDEYGNTALDRACQNPNISMEIISKLIDLGGKELVIEKDQYGATPLHWACQNQNISLEIISKLIDLGGKEVVIEKNRNGNIALHRACQNQNISLEKISKLIEVGGQDLVLVKDDQQVTILNQLFFSEYNYFSPYNRPLFYEIFILLLNQSIIAKVGGEFGIGGLFGVASTQTQDKIYAQWDEFAPHLKTVIEVESSQQEDRPPLLQAAIHAKAPLNIIQHIINHFGYSILKRDSMNRLPIDLAIEEGLVWRKGLEDIIEATALVQQHKSIFVAAQHGLKWNNGMRELAESKVDDVINDFDSMTGLCVFMVAGAGVDESELSSTYALMRMNPQIQDIECFPAVEKRMKSW